MVNSSALTQKVTFQVTEDGESWRDVCMVYANITGLRNSEYWLNYAGGNAEELFNVSVRYKKELMDLLPQTSRIISDGKIYDIISPPDDVLFKHREIKFRIRRQLS